MSSFSTTNMASTSAAATSATTVTTTSTTTTTTTTPTTTVPSTTPFPLALPWEYIAAIGGGCLVFIILVIVICCCCIRKRRRGEKNLPPPLPLVDETGREVVNPVSGSYDHELSYADPALNRVVVKDEEDTEYTNNPESGDWSSGTYIEPPNNPHSPPVSNNSPPRPLPKPAFPSKDPFYIPMGEGGVYTPPDQPSTPRPCGPNGPRYVNQNPQVEDMQEIYENTGSALHEYGNLQAQLARHAAAAHHGQNPDPASPVLQPTEDDSDSDDDPDRNYINLPEGGDRGEEEEEESRDYVNVPDKKVDPKNQARPAGNWR